MSQEIKHQFNLFNVYALNLLINENHSIYDFFINECQQQNTNNLIINYENKTINIIFNNDDEYMLFYFFKEDPSLYTFYENMIPVSNIYNQTDAEKEEFIDFLNYLNITDEPYLYNISYMN
jgi:hypothetical protein